MAELHRASRAGSRHRASRHLARHGPRRGALHTLRRASRTRLSRWTRAERAPLLHQLGVARPRAREDLSDEARAARIRRVIYGITLGFATASAALVYAKLQPAPDATMLAALSVLPALGVLLAARFL